MTNWLNKITDALMREPQDKEELIEILRDAYERKLMDKESLTMIEGVLQISQMQVRDIMIPKAQATFIVESNKLKEIIPTIINSGHSRFPVLDNNHTEVLGILLAKEILPYLNGKDKFKLEDVLRPVTFTPESKRLDTLLKEFKQNKNHMAIVANEHGGMAGLITLEDILEQIVGQIEDESDPEEPKNYITKASNNTYIVNAQTPVLEFNSYFNTNLDSEAMDTIGGLVLKSKGYMPTKDEVVHLNNLTIRVISADQKMLKLLEVTVS